MQGTNGLRICTPCAEERHTFCQITTGQGWCHCEKCVESNVKLVRGNLDKTYEKITGVKSK